MIILILIFIGGIFLGLLFGIIILKDEYLGPNSKDIYFKKFKQGNECYRLIPKEEKCDLLDEHI
jgi:hypothetical protein